MEISNNNNTFGNSIYLLTTPIIKWGDYHKEIWLKFLVLYLPHYHQTENIKLKTYKILSSIIGLYRGF